MQNRDLIILKPERITEEFREDKADKSLKGGRDNYLKTHDLCCRFSQIITLILHISRRFQNFRIKSFISRIELKKVLPEFPTNFSLNNSSNLPLPNPRASTPPNQLN
jgi:hypothetical protein